MSHGVTNEIAEHLAQPGFITADDDPLGYGHADGPLRLDCPCVGHGVAYERGDVDRLTIERTLLVESGQ